MSEDFAQSASDVGKVVWLRSLAIIFGSGSIIAFALGVLFLMRAVVTFW